LKDSDHFEKAAALMTMHQLPISLRARITHLFSKACLAEEGRREDGLKLRVKAQHLRQLMPGGKDPIDEDEDEAYDRSVNVLDR
jgi:hypothetical protein